MSTSAVNQMKAIITDFNEGLTKPSLKDKCTDVNEIVDDSLFEMLVMQFEDHVGYLLSHPIASLQMITVSAQFKEAVIHAGFSTVNRLKK